MLIPPINTKGVFKFIPPFDSIISEGLELRVTSIRSLNDMEASGEDPLNTVYLTSNMTEEDFKSDAGTNVPIVVLVNAGGGYYYIPANRILTVPDVSGVRYQEKILAINLGAVPVIKNLDLAMDIVKQDIYDVLGIESDVKEVLSSAVKLITPVEHESYTRLLDNRSSVDKSYRTKYLETKELLDDREIIITKLEDYIKTHCNN